MGILKEHIKRFNQNTDKFYGGKHVRAWIKQFWCALRFGASFDDFFMYEFYKKSNKERNKFLTYKRSKKIISKYNDLIYVEIFQNKREFLNVFKDYIGREFLSLDTATQEEFESFCKRLGKVIIKPYNGAKGDRIEKIEGENASKYSVDDYRDYIAEEYLIQHDDLSKLSPTSVNTIRVITMDSEIVACALRIGNGRGIVDNFSVDGLAGYIDLESGVMSYPCINFKLDKFEKHPYTGEQLVGFKMPNWEELKEFVIKASSVIPQIRYVGWDIAVLKDGFAIIEANHDPGHRIIQSTSQIGIYERIKEIIKSKKNKK